MTGVSQELLLKSLYSTNVKQTEETGNIRATGRQKMAISSSSCSFLYNLFLAEGGGDNDHLQEQIRRGQIDIVTGSLKLCSP